MQKLSGNGTAFVEIDGHAEEYDLSAGQEMVISTGYLAAMEETCTMDIVTVKGVKNMRNLEKYRKEVLKITKSYSKEVEDAIKEVLEKSYDQGEEHVEKGINLPKDGEDVGKVNMRPPAESHFFGTNKKKLNAFKLRQQRMILKMLIEQSIDKWMMFLDKSFTIQSSNYLQEQ